MCLFLCPSLSLSLYFLSTSQKRSYLKTENSHPSWEVLGAVVVVVVGGVVVVGVVAAALEFDVGDVSTLSQIMTGNNDIFELQKYR